MSAATRTEPVSTRGETLSEKVALLSRRSTYGAQVDAVDCVETHMSLLFFTGDTVYKLKKPVVYSFLDFSTLAARERNCRDELRLNRRLAPDVYLGLSKITREADGTLALDGAGPVVDWLVRMRRLPRREMLDQRIAAGSVAPDEIDAVAVVLTRFYTGLSPSRIGADEYVAQLRNEHRVNCAVLAGFESSLSEPLLADVQRFLDQDHVLLRARIKAGRVVDGHGDLRPEHVCLNTPPVIIDCLEFNERLRQVDPFDEITFLGMDCARLGAAWIGAQLLARLSQALGDVVDPHLLRFYARYRACIRARLAVAHLGEPTTRDPQRWPLQARAYLRVGHDFNPAPSAR